VNRLKVCVYAICKNEEQFVDRWMDSVHEADCVVVLDTGSTDSTVEKLKARGALVHESIISPWRFDVARNKAMDAIPEDVDICVSNDLDEVFESGWRAKLEECWKPETTRARYRFIWQRRADGSIGKESHMEKIHLRKGFRWVHPVHEVLRFSGPGTESVSWADGVVLHHYPDLGKPRSQYLPLLELSAAENPDHGQTLLWLGREYVFNGRPDDAISTLKRHLSLPTPQWDVERCASARFIAKAYQLKGDMPQAQAWLYRAISECIDTREPYHQMAVLGYLVKDWSLVLSMTEKMLALTNETRSGYLKEPDCWGASPHDLAAIATYWMGLYQRSCDYSTKALEMDPGNQRIADNFKLAAAKLERARVPEPAKN
jgi:hypothetical protein